MIQGLEGGSTHQCAKINEALGAGETRQTYCNGGTIGNIVKIILHPVAHLTLCEVEVYGIRCKSNSTGRSCLNSAAPLFRHYIDTHLYKHP